MLPFPEGWALASPSPPRSPLLRHRPPQHVPALTAESHLCLSPEM